MNREKRATFRTNRPEIVSTRLCRDEPTPARIGCGQRGVGHGGSNESSEHHEDV